MSKHTLTEEIHWELSRLERLAEVARELASVPAKARDPWDATAAAKYVSDVFHGLENLWKRRCVHMNEVWPAGPESHAQVLSDFLSDAALGGRLSTDTANRLRLYKSFRHRFVHGYGFEPAWETVAEPLRLIPETVAALKSVWEQWIAELPDDGAT